MIWAALGLLALAVVCVIGSALNVSSGWDDVENYEEDDD